MGGGLGAWTAALFAMNALLQLVDGWATYIGCTAGFAEGNPLVRLAMQCFGLGIGLAVAKTAAFVFLGYLWCVRTHRYVPAALAFTAFVYVVLSVVPWSVALVRTVATA